MKEITIGVLGLQGAIEEHMAMIELALERKGINGNAIWAKSIKDIQTINGLIVPGGESTAIGRLTTLNATFQVIKERIHDSMPVLGTCAGLIMLAKKVYDRIVGVTNQPILGIMDIVVERNSFGRQRESFEADLEIPILGEKKFRGIFIRAPLIREIGPGVKVLSKLDDMIIAVQQGNMIGTVFHPELTDDTRLHEYFLDIATQQGDSGNTA